MFDSVQEAILLLIVVCVSYGFYIKFIKPTVYWRKKGVFHVNLYRRLYEFILSDKSFLEAIREAYNRYPDRRYYGSYQFLRPSLFVKDLDLIKKVTVKDFDYFHDHSSFSDADPILTQTLFSLKGQQWKNMRSTLSPAFTSSKMRLMFVLMIRESEKIANFLMDKLNVDDNSKIELELKDFYAKYTNDVIASCMFGIECDSLKNQENDFYKMGTYISAGFTGSTAKRGLFNVFFPWLAKTLDVKLFPDFVTKFFEDSVRDNIAYREKEQIIRPDLIHLLMQARKGQLKTDKIDDSVGFATTEETENGNSKVYDEELSDDVITAQALSFFIAGFETIAGLLSFLSYSLAVNPRIQHKLQKEIDETLTQTKGKLDYDSLVKMKYLDQVISETLRMYPPAIALTRVCTKDYLIPAERTNEKDFLMEKGCLLAVPVYGLHMSEEFFPEPDKFDPERFSDENRSKLVPGSYIPFGSGPRNCIGSRFSILETKVLVVTLLSKISFVTTNKTEVPIKFAKSAILSAKNGIWLSIEKRTN